MASVGQIFVPQEMARRVDLTRNRMHQAEIDLLIVTDPANMNWLTGYDGWSFYVPQAVLIAIDQAAPLWFGRAQDAKAAQLTTTISNEDIVSFSESLVMHPDHHPFDELATLIDGRGWSSHRIGVEMDAYYYTARGHAHLVRGLPNARFLDCQNLVNWARLVKSAPELAVMREAGLILNAIMENALEKMAPGVPQNEVIAEVYRAQIQGIEGAGGDYAAICPLMPVGVGTSTPHLTWTDAPLPENSLAMIEVAGVRHRYHAPITRTVHFGEPPTTIRDLASVVIEGGDQALAAAKPGMSCAEVEAVWQRVLNKHGLSKDSRVGYPIGLAYPPDWGERTCSFRPGDKTVLEAGMCFHFQSGVWLEDIGVAISEAFVVGERGGERLTDVARELIVIG